MRKTAALAPSFDSLDLESLDEVVGGQAGLAIPSGGSERVTTSGYTWWGMNYTQTNREVLDAGGHVVGSEVVRPGSYWSDHTVTTNEGSSTSYSTGGSFGSDQAGGSAFGSFTTHYGPDGQLSGLSAHAEAEAHANGTPFGDLSAAGQANAHGAWDENGVTGHADVQGGAQVVDPASGWGIGVNGEGHADGHLGSNGASWDVGAQATGNLSHDGEQMASLTLAQVGTAGHFGYDENGDLSAQLSGRLGALGERASGTVGGTLHGDGTIDGNASLTGHFGTDGKYGLGGDATIGAQGTYHPDGSFDAGLSASANGHAELGRFSADAHVEAQGTGHWDSEGHYQGADVGASGQAGVNGPWDTSASVNGSANASFDADHDLTSYETQGGAEAHAFGQDWSTSSGGDDGSGGGDAGGDHDYGGDAGGDYDAGGDDDYGGDAGGDYDAGGDAGGDYDAGGDAGGDYDYGGDSGGDYGGDSGGDYGGDSGGDYSGDSGADYAE